MSLKIINLGILSAKVTPAGPFTLIIRSYIHDPFPGYHSTSPNHSYSCKQVPVAITMQTNGHWISLRNTIPSHVLSSPVKIYVVGFNWSQEPFRPTTLVSSRLKEWMFIQVAESSFTHISVRVTLNFTNRHCWLLLAASYKLNAYSV